MIRSTSCLVLGFRGRRIEWHHFRFDQTQDGGHDMTYMSHDMTDDSSRDIAKSRAMSPSQITLALVKYLMHIRAMLYAYRGIRYRGMSVSRPPRSVNRRYSSKFLHHAITSDVNRRQEAKLSLE